MTVEKKEIEILKKCGWSDKQLGHLGTMVNNIVKQDGEPIMDVISHRLEKEVYVEWFIPTKDSGNKMSLSYSTVTQSINKEKTTSEIVTSEDMNHFLIMIEATVSGNKGMFFPGKKIEEENTKKLKFN